MLGSRDTLWPNGSLEVGDGSRGGGFAFAGGLVGGGGGGCHGGRMKVVGKVVKKVKKQTEALRLLELCTVRSKVCAVQFNEFVLVQLARRLCR